MCKIVSSRDKNLSSSKLLVLFTELAMFQQGIRPPALPWLDWAMLHITPSLPWLV
jgi:hypothetical protein